MRRWLLSTAIALLTGATILPASASTVFNLDVISKTNIGTGVQGTVTLTQNGLHEVDVEVLLSPGVKMINTGGPHTPFAFNLSSSVSAATVTVTSVNTPSFFADTGSQSATPYGEFTNGMGYSGGKGGKKGSFGPLDFKVVFAGEIKISDFVTNAGGYYFAADLLGTGGYTGSVAANGFTVHEDPTPTPLPGALLLFGTVITGYAGIRRIRRKKLASAAVAT